MVGADPRRPLGVSSIFPLRKPFLIFPCPEEIGGFSGPTGYTVAMGSTVPCSAGSPQEWAFNGGWTNSNLIFIDEHGVSVGLNRKSCASLPPPEGQDILICTRSLKTGQII